MRTHESADAMTTRERRRFAGALAVLALIMLAFQGGCALPEAPPGAVRITDSERPPSETAAYVMRQQHNIVQQMANDYPGVRVALVWRPCGDENSFYKPWSKNIVLCAEMLEHPAAAIQFAAHEMGHAVTDYFADIVDENAADELAILAMTRHGWIDEMLGAALYMQKTWPAEHIDGDPHPAGKFRAWELMCAEAGYEGTIDPERPAPEECTWLYEGLMIKWDFRIPRAPLAPPAE